MNTQQGAAQLGQERESEVSVHANRVGTLSSSQGPSAP